MVAFSVAASTREAFGAYLPSWAQVRLRGRAAGAVRPGARRSSASTTRRSARTRCEATWLQQLPGCELDVQTNAGHYAMYEAPVGADDQHREDAVRGRRDRCAARPAHVRRTASRSTLIEPAARRRAGRVGRRAGTARACRPVRATTWCSITRWSTQVLKDPATFSSAARGTQIRDPATAEDLRYVQRMMLNMDPPEHSRLRRHGGPLVHPARGRRTGGRASPQHAAAIVDRMLAGPARVRLRQGRRRRPAAARARRRPRRAGARTAG